MTREQWSANTEIGRAILAEVKERLEQWQDGCMTDDEFLITMADWLTQAANTLQNAN